MKTSIQLWFLAASLVACAAPPGPADEATPEVFDVVQKSSDVPSAFTQSEIVSDAFFNDADWIDAAGLRRFFERVPGAGRSWMAGATVGGRDVASLVVEVARAHGLNPAVLTARMQIEASAVSPSARPSDRALSHLMGCGCPDGAGCDSRMAGFQNQLRCAAQTFRALHDDSRQGVGPWRMGRPQRSLDGYSITPRSHATAAHYAYTPWVLPGKGGNWLAWKVLRDYAEAMRAVRGAGGGEAPACATFSDVGPDHSAFTSVEAGVAAGYWSGCSESRFCVEEGLSRAAAASILGRVVKPRAVPYTGRFSDVPGDHWAARAIESLAAAGLVSGCGDGRFCPDRLVTRAELASLLSRAAGVPGVRPTGRYDDVPAGHWAAAAIEALAPSSALGVCGPDRFCPDAAASRGQTAIAFARVFGLSPVTPCD